MGWGDIVTRVGLGVSTGGLSELGYRSSLNPANNEMINQSLLETPEKTAARQKLAQFIQTGTFGGFTAGTPYSKDLGYYKPTDLENAGQNKLASLVNSNYPELMGIGGDQLKQLLTTDAYNPMAGDQSVYKGLTGGIDRNVADAQAGAKRQGSYMGNLYSTEALNKQGDIAAQGAINKNSILANLYQTYVQQKLGGINTALNYGTTAENIDQNRIAASQQYGGLNRILQDQELKDKYAEFQRQRQELQLPIQVAGNMMGSTENYTIPGIPKPNPWDNILNSLIGAGSRIGSAALTRGASAAA